MEPASGTIPIKGSFAVTPTLAAGNVNLYLVINNGKHGLELWKSDGTAAGTVLVKDIMPGAEAPYHELHMTNVDGTLFFTAFDAAHGVELWKSDGTAAGTMIVRDINPGTDSSNPYGLTSAGGWLFFGAYDPAHGVELWKSDGTTAGTKLAGGSLPGTGKLHAAVSDPRWQLPIFQRRL